MSELVGAAGEAARQGALKMERSMSAAMERSVIVAHSKKTMPMDKRLAESKVSSYE